ncbi:Acyltransferase [Tenacibaculum litopenaei]|uniref:lysophospholipid acyltransferase family protein n=1 Tax=Tenacibaculum litopenaei TaxID=396016 RepID=UPI0038948005
MKTKLYTIVKSIVKTGLFFYSKKITVHFKAPLPKDGAILFTANHPNGLLDPLLIATRVPMPLHFLVQAGVFKNPRIARYLSYLGMMPIFRIRDGLKSLAKNEAIFEQCEEILANRGAILIFPEGSHHRNRTVRTLSKGFTRILFRALEKNPTKKIYVVPVGITYQQSAAFPSKSAVHFGTPIVANTYYNAEISNANIQALKREVSEQLKTLSVHIPNDEHYDSAVASLVAAQTDFTAVTDVNKIIATRKFPAVAKKRFAWETPLWYLIVINSILPYLLWRKVYKKIKEIEFVDTFRFSINLLLFPLFYSIQSTLIGYFFTPLLGVLYFCLSCGSIALFTRCARTLPQ